MNFFQQQEKAHRNTKRLFYLFALAVSCICAGIYFILAAILAQQDPSMGLWQPDLLLKVSIFILVLIGFTSLSKMRSLSGGGSTVCEMMGGRLVSGNATTANERQLVNIVEEMSIASGVPVPSIYVVDDESINAFAAGYTKDDAAVAVTTGCMNLLNRDELQGVIGHEFSHILNGDMRINIRLIGILHGILFIGLAGTWAMRMASYSSMGRSRSKDSGQAALAMFLIGLALMIIGFVGVFFGNVIKAGLSRQREYLADASAVQFTRNKDGIRGALIKIKDHVSGSSVSHPKASELSHMFFANGIKSSLAGMFATHPPLEERISRLGGEYTNELGAETTTAEPSSHRVGSPANALGFAGGHTTPADSNTIEVDSDTICKHVGDPSPAHVEFATSLIANIPNHLIQAAHTPLDAVALVYLVLLDPEDSVRNRQLNAIEDEAEAPILSALKTLSGQTPQIDARARLPLLELAFPTLRQMTRAQYEEMLRLIEVLIRADGKLSLFEFALHKTIKKHLSTAFDGLTKEKIRYKKTKQITHELSVVLSSLAHAGHPTSEEINFGRNTPSEMSAHQAFQSGVQGIPTHTQSAIQFLPTEQCTFAELSTALDKLAECAPAIKKQIIDSCAHCALADQKVSVEEAELLRVFADTMGCPIPPFLPTIA
jgi:Zn-dependent protease with chaperone function